MISFGQPEPASESSKEPTCLRRFKERRNEIKACFCRSLSISLHGLSFRGSFSREPFGVDRAGREWASTMWIAFIPKKKTPQFAVWIETADGAYISTITVTKSSGKNEWIGNPKGGRPEALPVWNHAHDSSDAKPGTTTDAMSSATTSSAVSVDSSAGSLSSGAGYEIKLEVNTSYDYNEFWPKDAKVGKADYSGVNGQPSLVYEGRFTAGRPGLVELLPVGQGSVDGSNGRIKPGLEGMTTALQMIKTATVQIKGD